MLCRDYLCGHFHRIKQRNIILRQLFLILDFNIGHNLYIYQIILFILCPCVSSWVEPHFECLE